MSPGGLRSCPPSAGAHNREFDIPQPGMGDGGFERDDPHDDQRTDDRFLSRKSEQVQQSGEDQQSSADPQQPGEEPDDGAKPTQNRQGDAPAFPLRKDGRGRGSGVPRSTPGGAGDTGVRENSPKRANRPSVARRTKVRPQHELFRVESVIIGCVHHSVLSTEEPSRTPTSRPPAKIIGTRNWPGRILRYTGPSLPDREHNKRSSRPRRSWAIQERRSRPEPERIPRRHRRPRRSLPQQTR